MNQGGTKEGSGLRGGASIHHLSVCLSNGVYFRYKEFLFVVRVPLFIRGEGGGGEPQRERQPLQMSPLGSPRRRSSDADVTGVCKTPSVRTDRLSFFSRTLSDL